MNRKGPWEGYRRQANACHILCRFLGKKVVFLARPVVSFPPSFAWTFSSKERRLGTRKVHPSRYFLCCFKISPTATSFLPKMSVVRNFDCIYFIIFFKENGLLLCHIPGNVLILCLFNEVGAWLKQLYSVYHLVLKVRKSGKFLLVESAIHNPQHGIQNPRLSVPIHSFTWGDIWHSSSVIVNNSLSVTHVMARFTDLWLNFYISGQNRKLLQFKYIYILI